MKSTQIPAAYLRWGSFNILAENNNALKEILDASAKTKAPAGSNQQLISDFFASCMDEAAIEKAGVRWKESRVRKILTVSRPN